MRTVRRIKLSRILSVLALFLIVFTSLTAPAEAAVPRIDAPITAKNVLSIAKKYDPDGYYLMKTGNKVGYEGFMDYFTEYPLVSNMDTSVHEMCHACTHSLYGDWEYIYTGKKKFLTVDYSDKMGILFHTKSMTSSVPKKYRTFRFSTYVSNPSPRLAANILGCYGLLNEFTAYCWGMNDTVSLFPYYRAKAGSNFNYWSIFINLGANDRLAYAEFRYYILHYLAFAKAKRPKLYKAVMKDASFKKAFKLVDKKFRANIKAYHKDLKLLLNLLNSSGHYAVIQGNFFYCDGYGIGMFRNDYNMLIKQVTKGKYKGTSYASIYKQLMK